MLFGRCLIFGTDNFGLRVRSLTNKTLINIKLVFCCLSDFVNPIFFVRVIKGIIPLKKTCNLFGNCGKK